jgi:CHAT domain-containing protein
MSQAASAGDQGIKVLFFAANPITMSALRLAQEVRQIEEKIRASKYRDSIQFISKWAVRPDDLQQALLEVEPHIVHFSGHGSEQEGIYLESAEGISAPVDQGSVVDLLSILKDNIRLVVLNACQTRQLAEAITAHIDCAIGMRTDIADDAAIEFSASFYRAIGFGRSIKVAFDLGRNALRLQEIPEDKNPELYKRSGVDPGEITLLRP